MAERWISLLGIVLLAACGEEHGLVKVLVTSDRRLGAIEKLHVTVDQQGQRGSADFPLAPVGADGLSMPQTLSLQLSPSRRGEVMITVNAVSATGKTIASATTSAMAQPSAVSDASVHLERIVSWKQQTSPAKFGLADVWGQGRDAVYVVGGEGVFRSNDRGVTWNVVTTGLMTDSFAAVNGTATTVYALTNRGMLAREQGGVWSTRMVAGVEHGYWSLWAQGNNAFIAGSLKDGGGAVFVSSDNGSTWMARAVPSSWTLLDIAGCADGAVYAVGGGGTIVRSTDNGSSWSALKSNTDRFLYGVSCARNDVAFAVGAEGIVLRTNDSGATWEPSSTGTTNALRAVWTSGPDIAYVVGDGGTILYTYDGGKSWKKDPSNTTVMLRSVWASAPDDVYAVGESGTILHLE